MIDLKTSKTWFVFSIIICILTLIASVLGIFNPNTYSQETANWALQARGQDIGNLLAVPVLLFSTYFLIRKSLKGFFVWLGVLMYFIYAYLVYSFAAHFNYLFLVYVSILGLSIYTLIGGLATKDLNQLSKIIPINSKTKAAATLLIIIGALFEILWLSEVIPAVFSNTVPQSLVDTGLWVNPIHVIDLSVVLPGMIITGMLFLKKSSFGYIFLAPWLAFSTLMGSSIVATMFMMYFQGYPNTLPPLIMTGIIVLLSLITLILSLFEIKSKTLSY